VLNGLKNLYKKLGASAALLSGLRAQDEQIAQLRASLARLLAEKQGLSDEDKAKATAEIESLLAYQAVSKDETERLRALYESAAARVAATEAEIATLRERLSEMENAVKDRGGRP
jgi:chromosome segregation ATPase